MKFRGGADFTRLIRKSGFFGVAPGTGMKSNFNAMMTVTQDSSLPIAR